MARQFWQSKTTGEIWAVELDEDGHVIGNTGPVYTGPGYDNMQSGDFTDEDIPVMQERDNDWLEAHKKDFVLFGDEEQAGKWEAVEEGGF